MSKLEVQLSPRWRLIAFTSLLILIFSTILWEAVVSPLEPIRGLMVLKVIPLLFMLKSVWRGNLYTMQWGSMLILLYFMEGLMRAMTDTDPASRLMARIELLASLAFFISALLYLRPAKQAAKRAKRLMPPDNNH